MHLGITMLNLFMQANFTGPELNEVFPEIHSYYPFKWFPNVVVVWFVDEQSVPDALKTLEIDGESPYGLMKFPLLLSCAHAILSLVNSMVEEKKEDSLFNELFVFTRFWLARAKGIGLDWILHSDSSPLFIG